MEPTLGHRLRQARERQILTQDELAKQLGITTRSLQDYEADRATPRPSRHRALIAWLDEHERTAAAA